MRRNILRSALAACGAFAVLATSFAAPAQDGLDTRVKIFLRDAELQQATTLLYEMTGLRFMIEGDVTEFGKINVALDDTSAADALQYICQAAGAYAERDENGVFVIRKGSPKTSGMLIENARPPVKAPKIIQFIEVMHVDPEDAIDIIVNGTLTERYRSYRELEKFRSPSTAQMIGGTINFIDRNPEVLPDPKPMNQFDEFRSSIDSANLNGGEIMLPGGDSAQRGGVGGGAGQPGGGGAGQPGGGGQNQGGAGTGSTDFSSLEGGQGLVPEGTESLGYDPNTNRIIFRGTDEAYQQLMTLLADIDQPAKQVSIKVEFITTSNSVDRSLGIDWLYQRGTTLAGNRPGTFARSGDPIFLNYATGNISTRLRAIMTDGYGRTVNAPLIRTLNNQPASVVSNTQISFILNQTTVTNGIVLNTPVLQTFNVSTNLSVRPRINGDGTITMFLTPQISDLGQLRRSPDGTEIPDILFQAIQVVAQVRDGETIALAGLTRKQDQFSQSRIPLLGELPIIGQLFRGRNSSQNTQELLIFVTPTILDTDDYGLGGP